MAIPILYYTKIVIVIIGYVHLDNTYNYIIYIRNTQQSIHPDNIIWFQKEIKILSCVFTTWPHNCDFLLKLKNCFTYYKLRKMSNICTGSPVDSKNLYVDRIHNIFLAHRTKKFVHARMTSKIFEWSNARFELVRSMKWTFYLYHRPSVPHVSFNLLTLRIY